MGLGPRALSQWFYHALRRPKTNVFKRCSDSLTPHTLPAILGRDYRISGKLTNLHKVSMPSLSQKYIIGERAHTNCEGPMLAHAQRYLQKIFYTYSYLQIRKQRPCPLRSTIPERSYCALLGSNVEEVGHAFSKTPWSFGPHAYSVSFYNAFRFTRMPLRDGPKQMYLSAARTA